MVILMLQDKKDAIGSLPSIIIMISVIAVIAICSPIVPCLA